MLSALLLSLAVSAGAAQWGEFREDGTSQYLAFATPVSADSDVHHYRRRAYSTNSAQGVLTEMTWQFCGAYLSNGSIPSSSAQFPAPMNDPAACASGPIEVRTFEPLLPAELYNRLHEQGIRFDPLREITESAEAASRVVTATGERKSPRSYVFNPNRLNAAHFKLTGSTLTLTLYTKVNHEINLRFENGLMVNFTSRQGE